MSYDFTTVIKYLKVRKATVTPSDFPDQSNTIKKYSELKKSNAVQPLQMQLVVPGVSYANASLPNASSGFNLVSQYNYVAAAPFVLTNAEVIRRIVALPMYCMVARWQEGGIWHRYIIKAQILSGYVLGRLPIDLYENQTIGANFAIEVYNIFNFTRLPYPSSTFNISTLTDPLFAGDTTQQQLTPFESLTGLDLEVALPETIPTIYPAGCAWGVN